MPGRCIGWLGPNGSGKTTLIRCMLGLARRHRGAISVRGTRSRRDVREGARRASARSSRSRASIHTLPGGRISRLRPRFAGGEALFRDRPGARARRPRAHAAGSKVKEYSLGMRQRLGVARSLLTDPELLILDEPSNGLDPAGMAEFREMIRSFVEEEGRTVFISSHLLDEVQKMADDIAIVQSGKLVLHGTVARARRRRRQSMRVRVDDAASAPRSRSARSAS